MKAGRRFLIQSKREYLVKAERRVLNASRQEGIECNASAYPELKGLVAKYSIF